MSFLLDRRRLLIGLAAASTAAAAPVAVHAAAPAENPDLLALADQLDAAIAEVAAARAHRQAVVNEWWSAWPIAPAAICEGHCKGLNHDYAERGLTGARILANGRVEPTDDIPLNKASPQRLAMLDERNANPDAFYARHVWPSAWWARKRDDALKAIRRKRPRHALAADDLAALHTKAAEAATKYQLAVAYEAERERVKTASGYAEAVARDKAAFDALAVLVGAIIGTPAETMAGVMVKAQALAAWEAEPSNIIHVQSWGWPGAFAAEVIRIASQSA